MSSFSPSLLFQHFQQSFKDTNINFDGEQEENSSINLENSNDFYGNMKRGFSILATEAINSAKAASTDGRDFSVPAVAAAAAANRQTASTEVTEISNRSNRIKLNRQPPPSFVNSRLLHTTIPNIKAKCTKESSTEPEKQQVQKPTQLIQSNGSNDSVEYNAVGKILAVIKNNMADFGIGGNEGKGGEGRDGGDKQEGVVDDANVLVVYMSDPNSNSKHNLSVELPVAILIEIFEREWKVNESLTRGLQIEESRNQTFAGKVKKFSCCVRPYCIGDYVLVLDEMRNVSKFLFTRKRRKIFFIKVRRASSSPASQLNKELGKSFGVLYL